MSGHQPRLLLLLTVLYILTASCTPYTENKEKPVVHNLPKFFTLENPDNILQDSHVIFTTIGLANRKKYDQREAQNERKILRFKVLKH